MIPGIDGEKMANVDAAWRHMEDPTNLMMVSGVMFFEDPIQRDDLEQMILKRLLKYNRFRQKVVDLPAVKTPFWVEESNFDMDYHLKTIQLPEPGDKDSLQQVCGELMSTPLDFDKPLWQIHILDNCQTGNAIVVRTHHCIADGIALVGVMLSTTGMTPEASMKWDEDVEPKRLSSSGNLFKQAGHLLGKTTQTTGKLVQGGIDGAGKLVQDSLGAVTHPSRILDMAVQGTQGALDMAKQGAEGALDMAKMGTQGAVTTAKMIFNKADPATVFKGNLGQPKLAAWSKAIPLEDVKAIRKVAGATVNDVLLAAMTGGLRRYMIQRGQTPEGDFRAAVPVNLRSKAQMNQLGNQFGLVFLSLPVGEPDPLERIFELKKRMDVIKNSPEAVIALGMLKAVGATPADIQRLIVNAFGSKTTAVMTNVPGPKDWMYLCGKKVSHMMFWVPCSGQVGMGISILSYAGQVRLGVATDKGLVPNPSAIIDGFYDEMDDMMTLVTQVNQ